MDISLAKNLFLNSNSSQHTKYVRNGSSQQANKTGPPDVTSELCSQRSLYNYILDQTVFLTLKQFNHVMTDTYKPHRTEPIEI